MLSITARKLFNGAIHKGADIIMSQQVAVFVFNDAMRTLHSASCEGRTAEET